VSCSVCCRCPCLQCGLSHVVLLYVCVVCVYQYCFASGNCCARLYLWGYDVVVDRSTSEPTATIFILDLLLAFGSDCSPTTWHHIFVLSCSVCIVYSCVFGGLLDVCFGMQIYSWLYWPDPCAQPVAQHRGDAHSAHTPRSARSQDLQGDVSTAQVQAVRTHYRERLDPPAVLEN
jgi:hypothetical protein